MFTSNTVIGFGLHNNCMKDMYNTQGWLQSSWDLGDSFIVTNPKHNAKKSANDLFVNVGSIVSSKS